MIPDTSIHVVGKLNQKWINRVKTHNVRQSNYCVATVTLSLDMIINPTNLWQTLVQSVLLENVSVVAKVMPYSNRKTSPLSAKYIYRTTTEMAELLRLVLANRRDCQI